MSQQDSGVSLDWKTIFSGITTAAVIGMAVFVQQVKTDVALLKKDIVFLIKRDVVTRNELELLIAQRVVYPWHTDKPAILKRLRALEQKLGLPVGD